MKVSVIIPTWNRGHIVSRAIKSVLDQTYKDFEILVCDDGSMDDTVAKAMAFQDGRVKWLPWQHSGRPAIPRNRGIKAAKGEWLAFLDSDDEWRPDKLEKQLAAVGAAGLKAASTSAARLIPHNGIRGEYLHLQKDRITFADLLATNEVITSSAIFHRSLLPQVIGFPENENLKALEDYALWLRISCLTDFAYINETLTIYRDDPKNSVRGEGRGDGTEQKRRVLEDFISWSSGRQNLTNFVTRARAAHVSTGIIRKESLTCRIVRVMARPGVIPGVIISRLRRRREKK